mmetsp:Transcript_108872/g.234514  ORF Transcript_108872/g.234514 Transcript_108872/m.234514 type:complete len:354 (+) Transcript_108872:45-1106(+)
MSVGFGKVLMNQANKPGDELRQRLPAKQHFWCSVVVLDLGEQELSPSKLQFPDRLFPLHEILRGKAGLQHEAGRHFEAPVLVLGQECHALGPRVHVGQGLVRAELALEALASGQTQGHPGGCVGALWLQRGRLHPSSLDRVLPYRLLPRKQLLLLSPPLLHDALRFALLLLLHPLLLLALPVHLQGLLVLAVLVLAQVPVLHHLLAASDDFRPVGLHLLEARGQQGHNAIHLHLAMQGANHADLIRARGQQDAEARVLTSVDHHRDPVGFHPRDVPSPEDEVLIEDRTDEIVAQHLRAEAPRVAGVLAVKVDDEQFELPLRRLEGLGEAALVKVGELQLRAVRIGQRAPEGCP